MNTSLRIPSGLGFISLASECPEAPVPGGNIVRIQVIYIPFEAPEFILPGLQEHVHLAPKLFFDPVYVPLHIKLRVSGDYYWTLSFQQLRYRSLPFAGRDRVTESWMKQDKAIKIRVEWDKVPCVVQSLIILNVGRHLEPDGEVGFYYGPKWIPRRSFRHGKFCVSVHHGLWANHDYVELNVMEK
jgi:hypothetical protein